jgi:FKBP-type peptidyl-prolyl cis-trans isomerase 2
MMTVPAKKTDAKKEEAPQKKQEANKNKQEATEKKKESAEKKQQATEKKQDKRAVPAAAAKSSGKAAENNDKVLVDYIGKLDDGEIFDRSDVHGKPLEFTLGAGQVIPGFEKAVLGMKVGEEKDIRFEAAEAYGMPNPELVKEVPRAQLPKEHEPKPGMMLVIGLPNGMQIPAKITSVTDDKVMMDLNHPLAGKALNFHLKLVGIDQ